MKHIIFLLGMAVLLSATCAPSAKKTKTYVTICFDVEDYITPASEGIDDIPKWLAETMTEVGVRGNFFVIGEKARSLEKRGRQDVIAAMAKHDIGSHTNYGSIHPTVTEILEKASWEEGIARMLENESAGIAELERIFGKRVTPFARHGGSYGPQLVAALAKMGKGYVYSPIRLQGHNATWFCNTLNFYGEYGYFDDRYYRDDLFEARFDTLKAEFSRDIQGVDVLNFFGCHPCKVRTIQFWDFNYYKGANPDSSGWKTPELRPAESMKTARKNFRRLMEYLKSRDDIEIVTFSELMRRFAFQKENLSQSELAALAGRILNEKRIIIDDYFSAAEIFTALADALSSYAKDGAVPKQVTRSSPFGPLEMPIVEPETQSVSRDQLLTLASRAKKYIDEKGTLPAWLAVDGQRIGAGSLLALFSAAYVDAQKGNLNDSYAVLAFEAYPRQNEEEIVKSVQDCKYWPVHREDLDMSHLIEMTKMQLWTLKPALEG